MTASKAPKKKPASKTDSAHDALNKGGLGAYQLPRVLAIAWLSKTSHCNLTDVKRLAFWAPMAPEKPPLFT